LAPLNMYTSENDKIEVFLESISSISVFKPLISDYFRINPDIFLVSFTDLCKYIVQQLPQATAQAARYANSSEIDPVTARLAHLETELAAFRLQANAASIPPHAGRGSHGGRQADNSRPGRGGPGRGRGPGRGPGRGSPPARPYCFHHGYISHTGRECKYMEKQEWDARFLDASHPSTIDGHAGSTLNA
jgi:hypothetical protein